MASSLTRNSARARLRSIAVSTFRMLLAFLLTFGTTLYAQSVYARDAFAASGSQQAAAVEEQADGSSGSTGSSQPDEPSEPEPSEPSREPEP